ncbi:hypothetical protein ACJTM1_11705 [Bacillus sp. GX]|uniref:HEAT repeat domain-containing protein n=1 Tax=Bacillus albus TaxID=2026189 RepID=A0ABM7E2T8_9BACI|nr:MULTISPECIES: hypothetical protein [Bacillus]HDR3649059.1 hypothetical protein [Bacillus anthracis]AZQ47339.1 hypothetical protein EJW27_12595 [Bacillus albus]MDC6157159.1 hypothetical protein [Bacillus albus]MDD8006636.1 hypothetical protein [Bacillus albus]MDV6038131.1 hypothetical protein [Bacillus sp. SM-B1]
MSNDWLNGAKTRKSRILKAVDGDVKLASKITKALQDKEIERVLSKVEWLVSEEKAVEQLKRLFKRMDIDIEVKYYPE